MIKQFKSIEKNQEKWMKEMHTWYKRPLRDFAIRVYQVLLLDFYLTSDADKSSLEARDSK
jgi:hypothetical protein